MISNFHQSSGPYEGSSYYTFDEPSPPKATPKNKMPKKMGRIFGLGKPKQKKSAELSNWRPPQQQFLDDNSTMTGQSLTYSTSAASYQTTGESTDSSGGAFGEILKLLDEEDQREMLEKRKQRSDRSMYSTTSSLAYSEGGTTLNYSEDGDQSYLEGTKLLGMLSDSPEPDVVYQAAGMRRQEKKEEHVMSPNKTPVMDNKNIRKTRDNSLRRERTTMIEEDEDPFSSSSQPHPWLCGIDFGDASAALRPFLCF